MGLLPLGFRASVTSVYLPQLTATRINVPNGSLVRAHPSADPFGALSVRPATIRSPLGKAKVRNGGDRSQFATYCMRVPASESSLAAISLPCSLSCQDMIAICV